MRRTIILLQADNLCFGKIFLELQNVADVRASPGINRLVLVADGADVVVRPGKHPHELILRTIGVLILIHQHVLKAAVVVFADRGHCFQQTYGFEQQVVEIQGVGLEQLLAVLLVNLRHALGLGIRRL